MRTRTLVSLVALVAVTNACGSDAAGDRAPTRTRALTSTTQPLTATTATVPTTTTSSTTTVSATPTSSSSTTTTTVPRTTAPQPAFSWNDGPVTEVELGGSWHSGCPVAPDALRLLHMSYWGFDARPHTGQMVVNADVVGPVVQVFSTLFADRFPIDKMVPQSVYDGNDYVAAAADDTSGFDCRYAVASGPKQWSEHAYGLAIDVNDLQNPYLWSGQVIPAAGSAYLDRGDVRPGMAVWDGVLVDAFASVGWQWGGRWTATPDYQHFSANGN